MSKYNLYVEDVSVEAVFNKLGGVAGAKRFLRDEFRLVDTATSDRIIDCDVNPHIPDGWSVSHHIKQGMIAWNPDEIRLYRSPCQEERLVQGYTLRICVMDEAVILNACVLDFLLTNPHLIPEDWKGKTILFWGTLFEDEDGNQRVGLLVWNGDRWKAEYPWLDSKFSERCVAAITVSPSRHYQ